MTTPFENFRKDLQLSQQQLGELIGVRQSAISQYEKKKRAPKTKTARKFIRVAKEHGKNYSLDEVLGP